MDASTSAVLAEYEPRLREAADAIYEARVAFLREHFEGFAADTVYFPAADEYLHWPARNQGFFEGFLDATATERAVLDELAGEGFELLGNGAFRHTMGIPGTDTVVKFGRGGPNRIDFDGRWQNLTEAAFAATQGEEIVVPCRFCAPDGRFAMYPRVDGTLDDCGFAKKTLGAFDGSESHRRYGDGGVDGAAVVAFRDRLQDRGYHRIKPPGAVETVNVGVGDGELYLIDVNVAADRRVRGLPSVVDAEEVIRQVDAQRATGEKLDVAPGGGLVEPDV